MERSIVAIHQPNYLPWIGYFHKIMESDISVFLDNVEHTRSFINRNKIGTPTRWLWLTVPLKGDHKAYPKIDQLGIDNSENSKEEPWESIKRDYRKANHFNPFRGFFEGIHSSEWTKLSNLNIFIVKGLAKLLGLEPGFLEASKLEVSRSGTELIASVCKVAGRLEISRVGPVDHTR